MVYAVYIAAVLGALAVYLILPHRRGWPMVGAIIGMATLAGFLVLSLEQVTADQTPGFFYYTFTIIALVAAVRVITHPRPVYSALYFVLVVLSSAGLLVLLQAEFMAFAMVIIYGGAILVTYMFVIMLATLPVTADAPETAAEYDTTAREPALATVMGFALVAALSTVIFSGDGVAAVQPPSRDKLVAKLEADVRAMPGKFGKPEQTGDAASAGDDSDRSWRFYDLNKRPQSLRSIESILSARAVLEDNEHVVGVNTKRGFDEGQIALAVGGSSPRYVAFDDELMREAVSNIDQVGLSLFQSHPLGIELAGVILLVAMIGAVVIAKTRVEDHPEPRPSGAAHPSGHDEASTGGAH